MKIIIDEKETRGDKGAALLKYFELSGNEISVKTLVVGDVIVNDSICFEIKRIGDFYNSIRGEHMWTQINNMRENYENNFIIISGTLQSMYSNHFVNFKKSIYEGAVSAILCKDKIKLFRVDNDAELVDLILRISERLTDSSKKVDAVRVFSKKSGDVYVNMLCCIKGVGSSKASKILEKFKFYQLFEISESELQIIDGIGRKLSVVIKTYLNRL